VYDSPAEEERLRALEAQYCSFGDTVHYVDRPPIFHSCEGSYVYDRDGVPYLDLQMWYSAVNFGYRNERLNNAVKRQLDTLPQVASQYLHKEKIELAAMIGQDAVATAEAFRQGVGFTGVVLTKLDGTAKGGIVFRVQQELGVPVKLVGLGEGPDDLAPFEPAAFVDALLG